MLNIWYWGRNCRFYVYGKKWKWNLMLVSIICLVVFLGCNLIINNFWILGNIDYIIRIWIDRLCKDFNLKFSIVLYFNVGLFFFIMWISVYLRLDCDVNWIVVIMLFDLYYIDDYGIFLLVRLVVIVKCEFK